MACTKQTDKCTRTDPNAPPAPPRLSQMPVEAWFKEEDERVAYRERLSVMEILVPGSGVSRVLATRGCSGATTVSLYARARLTYPRIILWYFPCAAVAVFTTISLRDTLRANGTGAFQFSFNLGGREYMLTLQHLADAWGLRNEGATFRSSSNPHGTWNEFNKLEAARALNLGPAAGGKYPISWMTTTHRLLLYMVSYVLLPRKRNHENAMEEDLPIVWAMAQEK
ncbi:hypothetical protein PIB30_094250 [Stylosanthes scabra]|uniref:Uncharacterized protein n=1 Tax=Stylosanthes scabra TaxID=79078 RepID=A0ABU6UZ07_9FABA|nr:hypothetical protein [Stylosanthes scabra]